ncbi:MAG: hypothetical protein EA397_19280 [Deltaproteobacteria bacterium]|nr:MAG: hypothetical protein EA397_19280 [Deltaproteobacteria bacterium]
MDPWKIATVVFGASFAATLGLSIYLTGQLSGAQHALEEAEHRATQAEATAAQAKKQPTVAPEATRRRARGAREPRRVKDLDPRTRIPRAEENPARRLDMQERRQQRQQIRAERMREAFTTFAENEDLDPEIAETAYSLWTDHRNRLFDLREQVMNGEITEDEISDQFRASREELADSMVDLLGEDAASRLAEQFPALRAR